MFAWVLILLTVVVIAFEIWYMAGFVYAYRQVRERMLLVPAAQGLLMLLAFAYIGWSQAATGTFSAVVVIALLIGAMLLSLVWRRNPSGLLLFLKSYPRGTMDVLLFRRPAADLKRRVRTK